MKWIPSQEADGTRLVTMLISNALFITLSGMSDKILAVFIVGFADVPNFVVF